MKFLVDVGNTTIHVGAFEEAEVLGQFRIPTWGPLDMEQQLKKLVEKVGVPSQVVMASVVSGRNGAIGQWLMDHTQVSLIQVGKDLPVPISVKVDHPKEVGVDRLLSALGALQRHAPPLLILDFGSAFTFDVVSAQSEYLGGVIAPGLGLGAKALHQFTSALPEISIQFDAPPPVIGANTHDCIASGLFWGVIGQIEYLVGKIKETCGDELYVMATGGDINMLVSHTKVIDEVVPELILEGLLKTAESI